MGGGDQDYGRVNGIKGRPMLICFFNIRRDGVAINYTIRWLIIGTTIINRGHR